MLSLEFSCLLSRLRWALPVCCLVILLGSSACSPSGESLPKLNDTGITWGGDYPKGNQSTCTVSSAELLGDIVEYQDCAQGLDSLTTGSKTAFKYVSFDHLGQRLLKNSNKRAYCVLDEISGLLWELKMPADTVTGNQGLHDSDDLYTWYNSSPQKNGGAIGDWNSDMAQCTGYMEGQPTTYCNIEEFRNRINRQGLCGFNDWRLPLRNELESLVNYGRTEPAIDAGFFPNTKNQFYWSISPFAQNNTSAWAVNFQFGYSAPLQRNNARAVRLVRTWAIK